MTIGQRPETREAIAKREVGHTTVRPATARFLVVSFLAFITIVPLLEITESGAANPWGHLAGIPSQLGTQAFEPGTSLWSRIVHSNRIVLESMHAFEDGLADSRAATLLRPPAQLFMTRWLGTGNELAYIGRDGWLFYRPDVDYVTNVGFLDPAARHRRITGTSEWDTPPQTDPRAAIVEFRRQLAARGITLIVVPTPVKPAVHPERLARRSGVHPPVRNRSYAHFVDDLRREGVLVFDPIDAIVETLRMTSAPQYLATDSHWRPETMEIVAERLAEFVRMNVELPPTPASYQTQGAEIQNRGDIGEMLDLPGDQSIYPAETVAVRRVVDGSGAPWRPSPDADVLLLGDSFSNIYSLGSMGWGTSAGLAEHLSYALQRPLDRIVQNDEGAYATRGMLHRTPQRLDGKRVVIYQFAERELAFGDWKIYKE